VVLSVRRITLAVLEARSDDGVCASAEVARDKPVDEQAMVCGHDGAVIVVRGEERGGSGSEN
jgi:hypothetical protein